MHKSAKNLQVFLVHTRVLPRDVREKIAEEYVKQLPISGFSWEFGFIHGQVSECGLIKCARKNPKLLVARDKVNSVTCNRVLHYITDPECFRYFMIKFPDFEFDSEFINSLAARGNLEILQLIYKYVTDSQRFFTSSAIDKAATSDQLNVIKFIYENIFRPRGEPGCTNYAIEDAALNGNLNAIRYLYEEVWKPRGETGCTYYAIDNAVKNGHLDVVKYIYEEMYLPRGEPGCTNFAIYRAAYGGQLEGIKYLYENIFRPRGEPGCDESAIYTAAIKGYLDIVKYIYENIFRPRGEPGCDESAMYIAALNDHLEVVRYLYENIFRNLGKSCDGFIINIIVENGNLDMIRYIYEEILRPNGKYFNAKSALDVAAKKGYINIVKYLVTYCG